MELPEPLTIPPAQNTMDTTKTIQKNDLISRASRYQLLLLHAQAALMNMITESTTQNRASKKKSQTCIEFLKQIRTEISTALGDL